MKRLRIFSTALIITISSAFSFAQDIQYNTLPVHYDISADLVPADRRIEASATITLKARDDAPTEIVLGYDAAFSTSAVFDADGAALTFKEQRDSDYSYITIAFPAADALRAGDVFKLRIDYGGVVNKYVRDVNTISEKITELGQALMWYPRDLDYSANDITFSCSITAPKDQILFIPSGLAFLKEKREENNKNRWIFETSGKTDWTCILAASNELKSFTSTSKGISGEIYYVQSSDEQISQVFENITSILDTYIKKFGTYDEKPFFRYFLSPRKGWSYVRGGTTFMPEDNVVGALDEHGILAVRTYAYLAHELSHLWWGNSIRPEREEEHPNSDWLSEGFADFSKVVAVEEFMGADEARDIRKGWNENIINHGTCPSVTKATRKACKDWYHWRDVTYYKAAFVLNMLRDQLGSESFFSMMRSWVVANLGKRVTTSQFLKYVSSFNPDFDRFADQWLLKAEIPKINVNYEIKKNADGFEVVGLVRQESSVLSFPLELRVRGREDSKSFMLSCSREEETFRLPLDFEPIELEVNPDYRVLMKSSVARTDADSR